MKRTPNLRWASWIGLLGLAVWNGLACPAEGAFVLRMRQGTGAWQTFTETSPGFIVLSNTAVGDFRISLTVATSNVPGSPNQSLVAIANSRLRNIGSQTQTLEIQVSATHFTSPQSPPPLMLKSAAGGYVTSGTLHARYTSYADEGNVLFGTGFATDTLSFDAQGGGFGSLFGGSTERFGFNPDGQPYSISNTGIYILSGGGEVTLTGGYAQAMQIVPEPGSLTLLGTGAAVLSAVFWRRRRSQRE